MILAFTKDDGLVAYFIDNLSTDYKSKNVIAELYNFLNSDLIALPESKFWKNLSELFAAVAEMLDDKGEIEG